MSFDSVRMRPSTLSRQHALIAKCRIIGHGVEADGRIFCCAHCAEQEGVAELRDRV
jgi:hypothetical protein